MASAKTSTLKRLVKARALRQGLIGGSPFWRVVWISQFAYKQFSKFAKGGDPPITFDEPLKEGEVWAVVHEPENTKKGRGEGRKFLIGPKRKKKRANTMTGLALGIVGQKILEAPSAERINQILGEDVFEPPVYTRAQKRAAKRSKKAAAKLDKAAEKQLTKDAKATAKELKAHARLEKANAKALAKQAAVDAKAAKAQAKTDARASRQRRSFLPTASLVTKAISGALDSGDDEPESQRLGRRESRSTGAGRKGRKAQRAAETAEAAEAMPDAIFEEVAIAEAESD